MAPRAKADLLHGGQHLRFRHPVCVIGDHRLLGRQTHLRTSHPCKPFQGFLDHERSTRSGHPFDVQDDTRFFRQFLLGQRHEGEPLRAALQRKPHAVTSGNPRHER